MNICIVSSSVLPGCCEYSCLCPGTCMWTLPLSYGWLVLLLLEDARLFSKDTVPFYISTGSGSGPWFLSNLGSSCHGEIKHFFAHLLDMKWHLIWFVFFWLLIRWDIFYFYRPYILPTMIGAYWKILFIFLLDYLFIADFLDSLIFCIRLLCHLYALQIYLPNAYLSSHVFYSFLYSFWRTHNIWEFPGQGLNPSCKCSNMDPLTH